MEKGEKKEREGVHTKSQSERERERVCAQRVRERERERDRDTHTQKTLHLFESLSFAVSGLPCGLRSGDSVGG